MSLGLFGGLSATEKLLAGLAVAGAGVAGAAVGSHIAEKKRTAIQEKIEEFAMVKSYLIKSLNMKGFHEDSALAVYLGTRCPTELDLDEKTGNHRGDTVRSYKDSKNPGSFDREIFGTDEIANQLQKAYVYLLQWGQEIKDNCKSDLKLSTIVFYMKLLRQIGTLSNTVFLTDRGLDFLGSVIQALHLTSLDPKVIHARIDDGLAHTFSSAIMEARLALEIAAMQLGRQSAQQYLRELSNVTRTLIGDISHHFISTIAPRSEGPAIVVDYTTLSPRGWSTVGGTLLHGIVYQIFGIPSKNLSKVPSDEKIPFGNSEALSRFLTVLCSNASSSSSQSLTTVFLMNLRKITFEGGNALYTITNDTTGKLETFKIPSGISPNLLETISFAKFVTYLENLTADIETTALLIKFQNALTDFATAKGNETLYGECIQSLLGLSNGTEKMYQLLLDRCKEIDSLSEEAIAFVRIREHIEGQGAIKWFQRVWYGLGTADRGAGDAVAASRASAIIYARADVGVALVNSLKKAVEIFIQEGSNTPTVLELNELALDLTRALALKRLTGMERMTAISQALKNLKRLETDQSKTIPTPTSIPTPVPVKTIKLRYERTNLERKAHIQQLLQNHIGQILELKTSAGIKKVAEILAISKLIPFSRVWGLQGTFLSNALNHGEQFQPAMFLCKNLDREEKEACNAIQMAIRTGEYSSYKAAFENAKQKNNLPPDQDILQFQILGGGFYLLQRDSNANFATLSNWLEAMVTTPLRPRLAKLSVAAFFETIDRICEEIGVIHLSNDIRDPLSPFCESAKNILIAFVIRKLNFSTSYDTKAEGLLEDKQRRAKNFMRALTTNIVDILDGKSLSHLDLYPIKRAVAESRNFGVFSNRPDQKDIFRSPKNLGSGKTSKEEGSKGIRPELLTGLDETDLQLLAIAANLFNILDNRSLPVQQRLAIVNQHQKTLQAKKSTGLKWKKIFSNMLSDLARCCSIEVSLETKSTSSFSSSDGAEGKEEKRPYTDKRETLEAPTMTMSVVVVELLASAVFDENVDAQFNLAYCYESGQEIRKDDKEAMRWYLEAARKEHPIACYWFGVRYYYGQGGIKKDHERALELFQQALPGLQRAAKQANMHAQASLARCYQEGWGIELNESKAVMWWQKAAEGGHPIAQYNMGMRLMQSHGIPKNESEAVQWYQKAASQGLAEAQLHLAGCFDNGIGVIRDKIKAVAWFRKAAEQGIAEAAFQLGINLINGTGVKKNEKEGISWLQEAATFGLAEAQYNLGLCFKEGRGVPLDKTQAATWFQKATEQGHENARSELEKIQPENSALKMAALVTEKGMGIGLSSADQKRERVNPPLVISSASTPSPPPP